MLFFGRQKADRGIDCISHPLNPAFVILMFVKIVIPDFKCPSLNKSYAGRHWSKRKSEADEIHQLVFVHTRKLKPIEEFPVDTRVIAYYKHKRRRDSNNVSDKELIDGLVLAGLLPDDSTKYIRFSSTRAVIGAENDRVEIEILDTE